jgi:hypothetical protein
MDERDDHDRPTGTPEEPTETNGTPPLPVALRNTEITEADAEALSKAAEDILAAGQPAAPAPKKVPEGKRVRVRR